MAVKKRSLRAPSGSSSAEAWANKIEQDNVLDPKAPRKFKCLTVYMNEYEYSRMKAAAHVADRGVLDFIRQCLKKGIAELIND